MIYIITALKIEAQAFVDKYKLQKDSLGKFTLFKNKEMMLIISGVGVDNAMRATQTLINHFDITDDDIYLNVGVCGASINFEIGELLTIDAIKYKEQIYTLNPNIQNTIDCIDFEADTEFAKIVDMESFGFYDAVIHSPAIKNIYILKVVSDHFEPRKVTKELVKSLLFNKIDAIKTIIE